jgi:hypothetical protein
MRTFTLPGLLLLLGCHSESASGGRPQPVLANGAPASVANLRLDKVP